MLGVLRQSSTSLGCSTSAAPPACPLGLSRGLQQTAAAPRAHPPCSPCDCSAVPQHRHLHSSGAGSSIRLVSSRRAGRVVMRASESSGGGDSSSWTWNSPDWRALQRKGRAAGEQQTMVLVTVGWAGLVPPHSVIPFGKGRASVLWDSPGAPCGGRTAYNPQLRAAPCCLGQCSLPGFQGNVHVPNACRMLTCHTQARGRWSALRW